MSLPHGCRSTAAPAPIDLYCRAHDRRRALLLTSKSGAAWYVNLLGGTKRRGRWRVPQDMRVVGPLGGANLDLSEAEMTGPTVLTKISLVGGVSLSCRRTWTSRSRASGSSGAYGSSRP